MPLHVEVSGPADAPVVVMGSSLGTPAGWMWRAQVEALSRDRRVVTYDTRGHGASPGPPGPYRLDDLAGDVLAALDGLGVRRFDAVGLSLGGAIAQQLALDAPDRVARLVLVCTSACFIEGASAQAWHDRAEQVRAEGTAAIATGVVTGRWLTAATQREQPELVAECIATLGSSPAAPYADCCDLLAGLDLRPRLGEILAPTLVVAGADDAATPAQPHAAGLAAGITGARLEVLDGAAHLACLDQPDALSRLLTQFCTPPTEVRHE